MRTLYRPAWTRLSASILRIGAALVLCTCAAMAGADDEEDGEESQREAPGIVIAFEGGQVGENMAKVLRRLLEKPGLLETITYEVKDNETICGILDARRFAPPCQPLAEALDRLNPKLRPLFRRSLKKGDKLVLPDVSVERYAALRTVSKKSSSQRETLHRYRRDWSPLKPEISEHSGDRFSVKYRAYEFYIETEDDDESKSVLRQLTSFRSKNILMYALWEDPPKSKLYSNFPPESEFVKICNQPLNSTFDYRNLSSYDQDALKTVKKEFEDMKIKPETVRVHLVDTVMNPSPNLPPAYGKGSANTSSSWDCRWEEFKEALHHSTHLAGIIASQENGYGFAGLAPNVKLSPFHWTKPKAGKPDEREPGMADRIGTLRKRIYNEALLDDRVLFLAALELDNYPEIKRQDGHLPEPKIRLDRPLERAMIVAKRLVVVAAGQARAGEQVVELSPTSPRLPQNLGDQENVIVVTACTTCGRSDAALLDKAYFSPQYVHVAAPGGSPIVGWIGATSVGAANGTSQAGIAASMISHFPIVYSNAHKIKTRLQITSRPLPNADRQKIAAGVVDPVLALLDPRKHWVKEGGQWRSVRIRKFSTEWMPLDSSSAIQTSRIRRLLKMSSSPDQWALYHNKGDQVGERLGEINRVDGINAVDSIAIEVCESSNAPKRLAEFDDFIPSLAGIQEDECATTL
jgi:subtilisin family serine protease